MKTSRCPLEHEVMSGAAEAPPPRLDQPDQPPLQVLIQIALSVPRTITSIRFAPHETVAGSDVKKPPRPSHPFHRLPSHNLCQSWLSAPRTKASMRFALQETAPGLEVRYPPCELHPLQADPFQVF